jgi:hypothetical protein
MSRLSISKAWEETKTVVIRESRLLVTVALAFVAIPVTIANSTAPMMSPDQTPKLGAWMILALGVLFVVAAGMIALSTLAISGGVRVGDAVQRGFKRLLPFCAIVLGVLISLSLLAGVLAAATAATATPTPLLAIGMLLLLILVLSPLLARFAILPAIAAAEDGGPVTLVLRGWALTRGAALKLWGVFIVIAVAWLIIEFAAGITLGTIVTLVLGPPDPGSASRVLLAAVIGLIRSAELLLFSVMLARIYAQLSGRDAQASVPSSGI